MNEDIDAYTPSPPSPHQPSHLWQLPRVTRPTLAVLWSVWTLTRATVTGTVRRWTDVRRWEKKRERQLSPACYIHPIRSSSSFFFFFLNTFLSLGDYITYFNYSLYWALWTVAHSCTKLYSFYHCCPWPCYQSLNYKTQYQSFLFIGLGVKHLLLIFLYIFFYLISLLLSTDTQDKFLVYENMRGSGRRAAGRSVERT